jgi:hypothetical protein
MKGIYLHPLRHKAMTEGRLSVLRVPFREQPKCFYHFVHVLNSLGYPASDGFAWAGFDYRPDNPDPIYFRAPYAPGDYFAKEVFRVSWCAGSKARGYLVGVEYKSTWDGHRDPHGKVFNLPEMHYCGKLTKSGTGALQSPLTMPEKFARYILTLGNPVPERLGDATMDEIYGEGVYFPPPYVGVNHEDGSAIEHSDIAMDPWQLHERFWNQIYGKKHLWLSELWTWGYPMTWRKR